MESRSILLSTKPGYVRNILLGLKKAEVRKSWIPDGTKVYLYCTKSKPNLYVPPEFKEIPGHTGGAQPYLANKALLPKVDFPWNGKVVGEFVVRKCYKYSLHNLYEDWLRLDYSLYKEVCLDYYRIENYAGNKDHIFVWYIEPNSVITYDKPRELSDFFMEGKRDKPVTRAPQSYYYVEEVQ